ncbi:nucleoside phosphorylase [Alkaliflexus imshenetskii]|uniref:nucleoside phosphorylase n=1 Tax=Alkaliflexus imshenetskii TaxID=286730 RepID=UPI00047D7E66|nr:nucleoside phosphorylase [Alkaliflexus imshenetskii]
MSRIADSELIINADGSVFHLHIKPGQLAKKVILVGDPGRVDTVAGFFDGVDHQGANREFLWKTGRFSGTEVTVLSSGIGTDNIDIVLNELDALVNVDFDSRMPKSSHTSLEIVRIGTSGSLQKDLPVDSWLLSQKAIGFDGLLNFYDGRGEVCDLPFESEFVKYTGWKHELPAPYTVNADNYLLERLNSEKVVKGVTISAPGFYGPQGRIIRLPLSMPGINDRISEFRFNNLRVTNYEMECSAIYGLSALLGHKAATVCAIIANRMAGEYSKDYKKVVKELIEYVLTALTK